MSLSEIRPILEALYAALQDQPFYAALERRITPQQNAHAAMLSYLGYSMDEAQRFGHVCTLDGVGASIWSFPLPDDQTEKKFQAKQSFVRETLGDPALELYAALSASMAERTETVIDETDWYLSILGISPAHQGRGLGGNLIRPVLDKADAVDVASYLETFSERNRSFYNRLGYETVGVFEEPITGASYAVMRREPNPSATSCRGSVAGTRA